jgi:4'-phosphopantetheinyl transferase
MTGTVHVCWSLRSADTSRVHWLDATEMERYGRLRRIGDRHRFLTSRVLLKTMLGDLSDSPPHLVRLSYECSGCGRAHGRPIVVEPHDALRWQVSLSSAGHHVMAAVTDAGPVGVDIEQVAATGFDGFDHVALSPAERAEVERCTPADQPRARAVYWVRKEAVLKATGLGLRVDPRAVEVSAPHLPAAVTTWHDIEPPRAPVQVTDIQMDQGHEGDGHVHESHLDESAVAAVAVMTPTPCELSLHRPAGSGWGQIRQG